MPLHGLHPLGRPGLPGLVGIREGNCRCEMIGYRKSRVSTVHIGALYLRLAAKFDSYILGARGTRGVSVLYASGDYGIGKGKCRGNGDAGPVHFATLFPALYVWLFFFRLQALRQLRYRSGSLTTSPFAGPWLTSVGGTMNSPEIAARISGGGFSEYFWRPYHQQPVVPEFLQNF